MSTGAIAGAVATTLSSDGSSFIVGKVILIGLLVGFGVVMLNLD